MARGTYDDTHRKLLESAMRMFIELWNTGGKPKYWTVLLFTSDI